MFLFNELAYEFSPTTSQEILEIDELLQNL
jgi:hypothetical protein